MDKTLYDMLVEAIDNGATDETLNTLLHSAKTEVQEKNKHKEAVMTALAEATVAINDYLKVLTGKDDNCLDNDQVRDMLASNLCACDYDCDAHKKTSKDSTSKTVVRKMTDKEVEETIKSFIDAFRNPLHDIF